MRPFTVRLECWSVSGKIVPGQSGQNALGDRVLEGAKYNITSLLLLVSAIDSRLKRAATPEVSGMS